MRRLRTLPLLFIGVLLVSHQPVAAGIIYVFGEPPDPHCTLPEAIRAANNDEMRGWCLPGLGADRILLVDHVVLETQISTPDGPTGTPSITSEITIEGFGRNVVRSSGEEIPDFRIFHVSASGDLTLDEVDVSRGFAVGDLVGAGGAVYNRGRLTVIDSTIDSNSAASPNSAYGGAIASVEGDVTIVNSQLANNGVYAPSAIGGAIFHNFGTLNVSDSLFWRNEAFGEVQTLGGAIYSTQLNVSSSTFDNSKASGDLAYGGGIYLSGEPGSSANVIENVTMSYGSVGGGPGDAGFGGGVYVDAVAAPTSIRQVTFHGNGAQTGGGALLGNAGVTVSGSLFSGSLGGHCLGPVVLAGGNVADDATCAPLLGALSLNLDPNLGDNGGPTETHQLLAGSPAINAGGLCGLGLDQRGAGRMPPCDSGAYEWIGCDLVEIENETIEGPQIARTGCHTVIVGPDVTVADSTLWILAGYLVHFRNDVEVESDGGLRVTIDPSLLPK